ncbi:MAG: class I SAM-dependent methyltransferase [Ginsengibacter sp.]
MRIIRSDCPVCNSENINFAIKAIDHTVSQEEYEIWQCNICSLRFTEAIPDKNEIGDYYKSENYISHSNIDKGLINSLYHKVRKRTLISKKKLIEKHTGTVNGRILDVGCGTGAFLHTMQAAGWQVKGLEPEEAAREKAKRLYGLDVQGSEMLFRLQTEEFDAITLWHVLEHVHDLHSYVNQLKKLLKPNGRLFIAMPNYTCYDQSIYKAYWAAYDVPRHLYHFSPDAMISLLLKHELKLNSLNPMFFDSFYVSMLSEKYKTGKNNLLKAFFIGCVSNYKALMNKKKCSSVIYTAGK